MNGDRLKIAVFIDFDNIEIGVKSTLNRHFDVGTVLEAIKERGEVVTKVAYGDWKRAGEHSRSMTQHAIQMVQRNLTPGGDKNGADINLALDALEMAFTRNHINAFVIVGGDSDFIALVEKLKQYDKQVLVVGGRSFTSIILQKNCHEFIAYENLISAQQPSPRRPVAERARTVGIRDAGLSKALPGLRRALKVLADREVSPQLGLLKSTLLQLDSTFSERDYGANTFRDFIEKMAAAGYVNLKQVDRSLLVELKDGVEGGEPEEREKERDRDREPSLPEPRVLEEVAADGAEPPAGPPPAGPTPAQVEECVRALQEVFQNAKMTPHWPMYVRNVKQYVKNAAPGFDEKRFDFANFLEAIRAAQRSGLFRLERNRQGILRVFPGSSFPQSGRSEPSKAESDGESASFSPEESTESVSSKETDELGSEMEMAPVIEEPLEISGNVPSTEPDGSNRDDVAARRRRPSSAAPRKRAAPRPRAAVQSRTRKKPPAGED